MLGHDKSPEKLGFSIPKGGEHCQDSAGKQAHSKTGVAESDAVRAETPDFAAAVAGIMTLPLSDAEKAEVVRRLLPGQPIGRS